MFRTSCAILKLHIDKVLILVYISNMTQTIPVTEARRIFLSLVDEINDAYTRVDLTKNGRIKASLVSPDYLDSLEETIYSLKNSLGDIKLSEKELKKGKFLTLEEIKKKYNKK